MAEYLSNKEFTQSIVDYREMCLQCDAEGKERPVIPNNIAVSFLILANKLSTKYKFSRYSYKDEMVSEALIACCAKICNFDPAITLNAFAYFTQICWFAFISVIKKEKKEAYIKAKSFYMLPADMFEHEEILEGDSASTNQANEFIPYFDVEEYERKDEEKRTKAKASKAKKVNEGLDSLIADE